MEAITKSAEETKRFGKKIAHNLVSVGSKKAVLCLSGDLGSGKTTFVQGFAEAFGINQRIVSPTFILLKHYKINDNPRFSQISHLDLYRLEENLEFEVKNLGIYDIWDSEGMITVVEWAEKIRKIVPKSAIWIYFDYLSERERKIRVVNYEK